MTDKDFTYITSVLDRSGSMHSTAQATVDGYNAFLEGQLSAPGRAFVTLAQFDDVYEVVYINHSVHSAPRLYNPVRADWAVQPAFAPVRRDSAVPFEPRGSTALNDAIGKSILSTGSALRVMPEKDRPGNVVFVILTDGGENASTEYNAKKVQEMIKHQREKYGWNFIFIGANQDALATGASLGISRGSSITYNQTIAGTTSAFNSLSASVSRGRYAAASGASSQAVSDSYNYTPQEREEALEE